MAKTSMLLCFLILSILILQNTSAQAQNPFDYFDNNWNAIGLKDYTRGARIGPDNTIYLDESMGAVKIKYGEELISLSREQGKTALHGWMPVIQFEAQEGDVEYEFTCWATPMPEIDHWEAAFDWPTDGDNFAVWVYYRISNRSAKGQTASLEIIRNETDDPGNRIVDFNLPAGEIFEGAARYAFFETKNAKPLLKADYRIWLDRTVSYWGNLMQSIAQIEVPEQKATEALKAAHVCQMIANDLGEVRGGEGFYDQFYIRDGAYQVMELEEAGMWDAARKSIELYLPRQLEDGRFESQEGQFDANGQAQWVLWNYYKMTQDIDFLRRVYPAMERASRWTISTLEATRDDPDFPGILPAAPADGEYLWAGENHIVGYDFWNLRGLLLTAQAARILGEKNDADEIENAAEIYRKDIDSAMEKTGLDWFPPSWEKDGTPWGNTETLWPTPIFDKSDPRVRDLIQYLRNELGGGYIEGTIQWLGKPDVIHPYMGAYTTMADLVLGNDEKVVEDFYWYLLHSTAAHAFPEGIFYKSNTAWSNTIPHVTGACNYAILLRHMLVHEDEAQIELLKAIPDWWLEPGQQIRITNLPTWYGNLSMTINGKKDGVEVKLETPTREKPANIILHLPANRPLLNKLPDVEILTREPQVQKWDFNEVVERYNSQKGTKG